MNSGLGPVEFEVIKHRLWQINDEQANAIKTISASPIVVEGNDYNVGLFTESAELVTAGVGSLVHVTTMGDAVASIIRVASDIREGDVFMLNDPFLGALHQNDVVMATPVFGDEGIVMWAANVLHHADVGGIDAGSFCINARTIFEDPPRFFMKIVDQGRLVKEAEHTFVSNSRLPAAVAIDLRAQTGALNVVRTRLQDLFGEVGEETVRAVMRQSIDLAERQVRDMIAVLPEGTWSGRAYMDGVRVGDNSIHQVVVKVGCDNHSLDFDYTGSSDQVEAAVNCTYSSTVAGSAVPLYAFLCQGDIDWNDGLRRCISVTAPEGSVVNARHPAPVSISTVGFRWLVTVAASQAVARMFNDSVKFRDRVCPSWNVSSNCNFIYATLPDSRNTGALLSDHRGSGAGARSFADGFNHGGTITSYASSIGNVEGTEWKLPLRYLYRRRLEDSGGPGRFRGGVTSEAAVTPYGVDRLILKSTNTAGTEQTNAHGIDGGYPGAGSQTAIVRGAERSGALGATDPIPLLQDFPGDLVFLPSKADDTIETGDVFVFWAAGGGGYGDPLDREPERVADDVETGLVSARLAKEIYGVVLNTKGHVLPEKTRNLRSALRLARKTDKDTALPDSHCRVCGGPVHSVCRPLSRAGPWIALRHGGDSAHFALSETSCASCGALIETTEIMIANGGD